MGTWALTLVASAVPATQAQAGEIWAYKREDGLAGSELLPRGLCTFEPQRVVCHAAAGYDLSTTILLQDGDDAATLEAARMTADFLGGAGGDDTLDLRDMAADSWQCGSGNDLVRIDPFDVAAAAFPRECESVRPGL